MTSWSIALVVLVAASSARADGFAWHAPSGCPDDVAVRQAVERRLEASLDSVALTADVEITKADTDFVARVHVAGTADRTLTSASCEELTDAVAIVLARLATEARSVVLQPVPELAAVVAPPRTVRRSPWNAGVRTAAIVGTGNAPELGVAGELAAWLAWRHAFVELAGARWLSSRAQLADTTMAGVDVQLDVIALRSGWQFGVARAWAVGELGALHGTGVGLVEPHQGSGRWLALGGGVGAVWRAATHVRGVVGLDLEIAVHRVQFALDSGGVMYRSSPVALRGSAGIELVWR